MDIGNAINEIVVALTFIMKKNNTMITIIAPSKSEDDKLEIERSIKSRCAKISVAMFNSDGNVSFASFIKFSSCSVSSIVPTPGCFVTVIITAGFPRYDAAPTRGDLSPLSTRAISFTVIISPLSALITVLPSASISIVATSALTTYSLPYP